MNIFAMSKSEKKQRLKFRCVHRHSGISHSNCYEESNGMIERVGYLDTETSGLNANWDFLLAYIITSEDGKQCGRVLDRKEILDYNILDKNLIRECCKDIRKFDRVIVYWGKDRRHDLPFLRTRALKWKASFPLYKEVKVTDVYDTVKNKLKLHRRSLQVVANFLNIPSKQHRLDSDKWVKAKLGHEPSLRWVYLHCIEDTVTLKKVDKKLCGFTKRIGTSI